MIPVYVDPTIHREIRVYAAETGKTMMEICEPLGNEFEQSAIKLVTQIKEMRKKAELELQQQEEEARIVAEYPILVTGKKEDPIGSISIEDPITQ